MELKQKASLTGFRILFVLDILLKCPSNKNEILEKLSEYSNGYTSAWNKLSPDTVKNDINILKQAGFEIINTGKQNRYRYKIAKNPIKFNLTAKELKALSTARNAAVETAGLEEILSLYGLMKKISDFFENQSCADEIMNFGYLLNINFETLKALNALVKRKKRVTLLYNSPSGTKKEITMNLKEIKYINSKIYVTGYSESYPLETILRLDNIIKIVKILPEKAIRSLKPTVKNQKALYKIKPEFENTLNLLIPEKIIQKNPNFILAEGKFENEFLMVQRLLELGDGLISIKNENIKALYLDTLKNIEKIYKER